MRLINELLIAWHKWRMVSLYDTDRATCRKHADALVRRIKARA